jgi:c-di-GMP-binding flagellar brake protein YcgR
MRQFSKYFKTGQRIQLRRTAPEGQGRFEALNVFFHDFGTDCLLLNLPQQIRADEHYPFVEGMAFEISSEAMGLGLRMQGKCLGLSGENLLRLGIEGEVQLFQRRMSPRIDAEVGLRYTRGRGQMRSFRQQWEKNVGILAKQDPANLPEFPTTPINLSSGGVRVKVKAPVEIADLALLLIDLRDQKSPICALAEVVWRGEADEQGRCSAGMQFLNILEEDQKRIATLIGKQPAAKA